MNYWVITYKWRRLSGPSASSWTVNNDVIDIDPLKWMIQQKEKYLGEEKILLHAFITSANTEAEWCVNKNGGEIGTPA